MSYNLFPTFAGLSWPIKKTAILGTNVNAAAAGQEYRTQYMQFPLYELDLQFAYLSANDQATMHGFFLNQGGSNIPFSFDNLNDDTVSSALAFATTVNPGLTYLLYKSTGGLFSEPIGQVNTVTSLLLDGVAQPQAGLSAPASPSLSQVAGGALAATTYFVKVTWLNYWGETVGSTEVSVAVSANNVLKVTQPASAPASAVFWNVYVSTTTGTEKLQTTGTNLPIATTSWTEPTGGLAGSTALPGSNTTTWAVSAAGNGITFPAQPAAGHTLSWTGTYYYLCRFKDDKLTVEQFMNLMYEQKGLTLRTVM